MLFDVAGRGMEREYVVCMIKGKEDGWRMGGPAGGGDELLILDDEETHKTCCSTIIKTSLFFRLLHSKPTPKNLLRTGSTRYHKKC